MTPATVVRGLPQNAGYCADWSAQSNAQFSFLGARVDFITEEVLKWSITRI